MVRSISSIDRFTVGTVGLPGERTFYLQVRSGNFLISNSIEKMQVSALSERLRFMLKEIRNVHPLIPRPISIKDSSPLETPIDDEFRIGSIAIFFDDANGMIQIDLREHLSEGEEDDHEIALIRLFISPQQALTFCERADLIISAGRLPCPFCGLPINPDGHLCSRANGYRR